MDNGAIKSRNHGLDFLKGLACISVVFIHCQFPGNMGMVIGALTKFAVPIFFMISGYYAIKQETFECKKKVRKIFKMILWAEAIFFFYEALKAFVIDGEIVPYLKDVFNIDNLIQGILLNRPIASSHLWFLYALIYCYFTLWIIRKFKGEKLIPFLIVLGHIGFFMLGEGVTILGQSYHFIFDLDFYTLDIVLYNSYIFRALPYFLMGYLFSKKGTSFVISDRVFYVVLVLGSVLAIAERYLVGWFQFYVGTLAIVVVLFNRAVNEHFKLNINNRLVSWIIHIGYKDSDFIYVIHILIASMLSTFMKLTGLAYEENIAMTLFSYVRPIFILVLSIIVAEMRNWLLMKKKVI